MGIDCNGIELGADNGGKRVRSNKGSSAPKDTIFMPSYLFSLDSNQSQDLNLVYFLTGDSDSEV